MSKVTVAEKLSAIGNNMARVYDTGFEKGFEEGKQFGDYAQGFEEGKQAEYDAFWDAIQNYGKRTDYTNAFTQWSKDYIRPKYKLVPTAIGGMFNNNQKLLAVEKAYFDFSQITSTVDYFCNACGRLLIFEDCGLPALTEYGRCWRHCTNIHTIEVLRSNENTKFTNPFENCRELENIAFEGVIGQDINFQWSTKLRETSIRSIITHLSDTASGKTLTLSKVAVDNAFMFSGDGGDVPGTDETNPYWPQLRDSKPNWTITLV
jgi:hypothetical protein